MISTILLVSAIMMADASGSEAISVSESPVIEVVSTTQNVRFRSTQKLRSNDGREIYFYSSGKCEGYDGDRLMFSTTYSIYDNNEIRLLDEYGNTVYKGSITWRVKGQTLANVTIAGTTYFAR